MVKIYGYECPPMVETKIVGNQHQRTVNFMIQETDDGGFLYQWESVTLEVGIWCYDEIVNAIIRSHYPQDRMEAVINNYLAEPTELDAIMEMRTMQLWRNYAKTIAREAVGIAQ